jgi:CBS-domain-containing membrane protein
MYDFIKKHFQGRFYRKARNVEEFIEDVSEYFLNGQAKKYAQTWEKRLCNTLKLIDPNGNRVEWTTEDRIEALEEAGVELEIFREKWAKEIRKLKEKKIEQQLKKQTKNMKPIEAILLRDNYLK